MNIKTLCFAIVVAALVPACDQKPVEPMLTQGTGSVAAAGDTSMEFGDYVVHFNAISTDQLTPEVAKNYGIVRSSNRALLNISILKKEEGTTGKPVPGNVSLLVANDTGQVKDSTVREIREGSAVYYIADYAVSNGETLVFNVEVTPEGTTTPLKLRFSHTFFGG